jgi:signal transduction histidine kinase
MKPAVLILSDDPEFARAVLGRWQRERNVPAFTVMKASTWKAPTERPATTVTLVTGEFKESSPILAGLEKLHAPVVFVAKDGKDANAVRQNFQRTVVLKRSDDWLDFLVVLAAEMLRRIAIAEHAASAEARAKEAERHAVLGKYMLEMRHTLNNALTSVLGNAELLLLEPGTLAGEAREQVDTIHNMSLRMHEVLQRFSSIESEMKFADKDSQIDTLMGWRTAVSGR